MVHYKLTYFNGRGRAEIIRLIFAAADEKYEDVRLEREKWAALKPKLAGKTDLEQLQADMIIDCLEDAAKPFHAFFWEKDETRKTELKKAFFEEKLPAAYASLESILKSNKGGDGFLVGDGLTWADLSFLVYISGLKKHGNDAILDKYPKLKALEKRVESVPLVAAWIAKRPVTDF